METNQKTCAKCKAEKPIGEFPKSSAEASGHISYCKPCWNEICREQRQRCKERNRQPDYQRPEGTKTCSDCGRDLPTDRFYREAIRVDGLSTICKGCKEFRRKKNREKNREKNRKLDVRPGCKRCKDCKRELPESQFYKDSTKPGGLDYSCKQCVSTDQKARRDHFKETVDPRSEGTKKCSRCSEEKSVLEFTVQRSTPDGLRYSCRTCEAKSYASLRDEVFQHYGGGHPKCAVCGIDDPRFLTIDHIANNGAEHKREIKGFPIYRWLKKNGFPEGYQLLCWNHNSLKYYRSDDKEAVLYRQRHPETWMNKDRKKASEEAV